MSTHKPNYAPSQQAIKIAVEETLNLTHHDKTPLPAEAVTLLRQASDKIDRADEAYQQAKADASETDFWEKEQEHKEKTEKGLTTDRNTPCLNEIRPDGQQECYLILSDEERAKGFVRPVRQVYRHVTCRTDTTMGLSIAETYARKPDFYGGTFCVRCGQHFPLVNADGVRQFVWVKKNGDAEIDERGQAQFVGE